MKDIEIARSVEMKKIKEVAKELNINENLISLYGDYKAKIQSEKIETNSRGKLILVTAINPTPYGEGKTTMSIGLLDGLCKIQKNAIAALREPSLGPVFGFKGGACGGGYSQMVPMEDINLHFTGDLHAITSANNLIAAAIYNHIYHGNKLNIDEEKIIFKRCLDVNDRDLRKQFNITAASEVMSVFCLAIDIDDLKERLDKILIAYTKDKRAVFLKDLNISESLRVILKEALKVNLVQSLENNPILVHGGPFANIAHGCNSVIATNLALNLSDYVITEAGFGADLGAEKFFNIKCRQANLKPNCIVLVATIKALKYNSMLENIDFPNVDAVIKGLPNLGVHIQNIQKFTSNLVVCLNRYDSDSKEEIDAVMQYCKNAGASFVICDSYSKGGEGAIDLANKVVEICDKSVDFKLLYDDSLSISEKIEKLAKELYRAAEVEYSDEALSVLEEIEKLELSHLPVCVSKTQYSLSDDPKKLGAPKGFTLRVRDIEIYNGAGFITVILGKTIRMPGLPEKPNYEKIALDKDANVIGLM